MTTPDPLATALPGGLVLLGPLGVGYCERALRLAQRAAARDGVGSGAGVRDLARLLAAALGASASGSAEYRDEAVQPVSDAVGTAGAAERLGITVRAVRGLCARGALPAVHADGRWLIDRADLEAYAYERSGTMNGQTRQQPGARATMTQAYPGRPATQTPTGQVNPAKLREALGLRHDASDDHLRIMLAAGLAQLAPAQTRRPDTGQDCAAVLDAAIRAGKFPPSRRAFYEQRWAADPDGTRNMVASLTAVTVAASGHQPDDAERVYNAMYPRSDAPGGGSAYDAMYPDAG